MTFKELKVGDTFDFVKDMRGHDSFYARCAKTGTRRYETVDTSPVMRMTVGTVNVEVYNVEQSP